jgi:UDP-N-acetylglucosamine 1-carboxyvinyltransferase
MFMGPFIHEFKSFNLPQAGGCRLGTRTVKPYSLRTRATRCKCRYKVGPLRSNAQRSQRETAEVIMYESGDTATETVLMAAARIPGKTVIKFASPNYHGAGCLFLI